MAQPQLSAAQVVPSFLLAALVSEKGHGLMIESAARWWGSVTFTGFPEGGQGQKKMSKTTEWQPSSTPKKVRNYTGLKKSWITCDTKVSIMTVRRSLKTKEKSSPRQQLCQHFHDNLRLWLFPSTLMEWSWLVATKSVSLHQTFPLQMYNQQL